MTTQTSRTFRILTVATLLLMLAGISLTLGGIFLIWVPGDLTTKLFADDFAIHRFHAGMISASTWVLFASVVSQLRRPRERIATMVLALSALLISLPADLQSPKFSPLELIVLAVIIAMLWFHPGRSELHLLPLHRKATVLLALGAVPGLSYAWNQLQQQLNGVGADRHLELGHYGFMAAAILVILVAVGIGVTSLPGGRLAIALGAAGAAAFGVLSILLPDQPSSPGVVWGWVALVWSGALILATWYLPGSSLTISRGSAKLADHLERAS